MITENIILYRLFDDIWQLFVWIDQDGNFDLFHTVKEGVQAIAGLFWV